MKYLAKKLAGFVMTMLVVSFLVFAGVCRNTGRSGHSDAGHAGDA